VERKLAKALSSVLSSLLLPSLFFRAVYDKAWRASVPERLGKGNWRLISNGEDGRHRVWFHGASVGEIRGISPLIKKFIQSHSANEVLISTTSLTGRKEAASFCSNSCLLPFDHPFVVRKVIERANPKLFVVTETELWPNMFYALDRKNIPIVLINGRLSDYSFPAYYRFRSLISPALRLIHNVLVQTELDRERFAKLGVDQSRITVVGSTKYDQAPTTLNASERKARAHLLGLNPDQPCFVAGSVRPQEEQMVIEAYSQAKAQVPNLQMIIAPRHPERFEHVANILSSEGLEFQRRSKGDAQDVKPIHLLDTLGELANAYGIASFSFVGGSLVNIGGHNPLEPAAYRAPVIMGPYTANVRDAISSLKYYGGLCEVNDAKELGDSIVLFSTNENKRTAIGENAYNAWKSNQGATAKVMEVLNDVL